MNSEIFRYPLLVREHHLDLFGHMNNATYLQILEEARWELVESRGFGLKRIQESGLGPTILECSLVFKKEIRLRERIVIETQLLSYESKVGRLRQDIVTEAGELCCEGRLKFALFDLRARKLVAPTPEWLSAIGARV